MPEILVFMYDSLDGGLGEQVMRPVKVPDEIVTYEDVLAWLPDLSRIEGMHYKVIVTSDVKDFIILKQAGMGRYAREMV